MVAPFAGARVETKLANILGISFSQSLPSRERELKRKFLKSKTHYFEVAPFAGARVETFVFLANVASKFLSLPSRERELKLYRAKNGEFKKLSLPSRERELKLMR